MSQPTDWRPSAGAHLRRIGHRELHQILVGHEPRWVAHALWQVWVVTALALFMADLIIRYASGLIGLRGARRGVKGAG